MTGDDGKQAKIGVDNEKYLEEQHAAILERMGKFDSKLYLEFGGKLVFDHHAARVLPGFDPNVKIRLLQKLSKKADIILCIYAGAIERRKLRADFGITYDVDALKLIDDLRRWDVDVTEVVITRYDDQPSVRLFQNKLERRDVPVFLHRATKGYPTQVDRIVSDEGYGANPYIPTKNKLVIVTGPGPGSGKLATCLSQVYHDHCRGEQSGYAKFETFPIWNLPLKHPVNVAYEAATADIRDFNLIDPFHQEATGEIAINYNRDVDAFPLVKRILERITGTGVAYRSPTDMGVNRAGFGIVNDEIVREAALQEIIRRSFRYRSEYAMGFAETGTVERIDAIMEEMKITPARRHVVDPAREAAAKDEASKKVEDGVVCGAAIELHGGDVVTGTSSPLMHAASAVVFNAIKRLARIPKGIHLLSPATLDSIGSLRKILSGDASTTLDLDEALIALGISATGNPSAQAAMQQLKALKGCEIHLTHIPSPGDEAGLRELGLNVTSDPNFSTKDLYVS
jgi:uncharacterized protein (UPF0371 family)